MIELQIFLIYLGSGLKIYDICFPHECLDIETCERGLWSSDELTCSPDI